MIFVVDLWMDGYNSEEEMNKACKEFIKEQLDNTATSVQVIEIPTKEEAEKQSHENNGNPMYIPDLYATGFMRGYEWTKEKMK